ncbi:MAG: hypothetical protein WC313_10300 [Candidatus Kapaibacterium sp.]
MKYKLLSLIVSMMILASAVAYSLIAYSSSGWTSSTGAKYSIGKAYHLIELGNGYSFMCYGDGICFEIIGNTLIVNEAVGPSGGTAWTVFPN